MIFFLRLLLKIKFACFLLILGFLSSLSLSYSYLWFLPIVSLAYVYNTIENTVSQLNRFILSLIFFYTYFLSGLFWMQNSFSNLMSGLNFSTWTFVMFFIFLNSLIFSMLTTLFFKVNDYILKWILISSSLYLGDKIREVIFIKFNWLSFGYSQQDSLSLIGYIPVIGVEGTTFILGICSVLFYKAFFKYSFCLKPFVGLLFIFILSYIFNNIKWVSVDNKIKPIKISIIQTKVEEEKITYYNEYKSLIEDINRSIDKIDKIDGIDINRHWFLLPESTLQSLDDKLFKKMKEKYRFKTIFSGFNAKLGLLKSVNGVIDMSSGDILYKKYHLIPIAEYKPEELRYFIDLFNIQTGNQRKESKISKSIRKDGLRINFFICYEVNYSNYWLSRLDNTNIQIILSSMSWNPFDYGIKQLFFIAKARALETGRPVILVSDSNYSSIIQPNGDAVYLDSNILSTLSKEVSIYKGKTPYSYWGVYSEKIFYSYLIILLLIFIYKKYINNRLALN
jgi:apolipoprotein N-acyltransferase